MRFVGGKRTSAIDDRMSVNGRLIEDPVRFKLRVFGFSSVLLHERRFPIRS